MAMSNTNPSDYDSFQGVFNKVLDKHVFTKRDMYEQTMTRALRRAIMLRSRLQNKHNKSRTVRNGNNFR